MYFFILKKAYSMLDACASSGFVRPMLRRNSRPFVLFLAPQKCLLPSELSIEVPGSQTCN